MKLIDLIKTKRFLVYSSLVILSYIIILIVIQWIIAGTPPNGFGLLNKPESSKYANFEDFVIFWVKYEQVIEGANFEWYGILTLTTFSLLILLSFISAINLSLAKEVGKGKKGAACGTLTSTAGLALITTSVSACPACGTAAILSVSQALIFVATGSTLGISALFKFLTDLVIIIGIAINLLLFFILYRKINNNSWHMRLVMNKRR